jgi:adenylate kinase family enzyme
MRRVSMVGNSGSGKTTTGRMLAERLGVPFLELDSIFHLPGWQERPLEEFRAEVAAAAAGDGWVIDGNYSRIIDLVWPRADTVVVFDFPRRAVMRQLLRRTLKRTVTREELWNGNKEPFSNLWRMDPNKSILRWAWVNYEKYHRRYIEAEADPANAHLSFVRLQSRADVLRLLDSVGRAR